MDIRQVRRFRYFRWMQGLAQKRRRMTLATRQLQANSFPIAEACACRERLSTSIFQGRKADVHKTLISASKVHSKGHVVVVNSNGGHIIPYTSMLARKIQQLVQKEIVKELGAIHLYLENGTHIGYTKIQQHVRTRSAQELCSMHATQQSEGPSAPSEEVSLMSSVGKAHTCLPAKSPQTKLQIRRVSCSS